MNLPPFLNLRCFLGLVMSSNYYTLTRDYPSVYGELQDEGVELGASGHFRISGDGSLVAENNSANKDLLRSPQETYEVVDQYETEQDLKEEQSKAINELDANIAIAALNQHVLDNELASMAEMTQPPAFVGPSGTIVAGAVANVDENETLATGSGFRRDVEEEKEEEEDDDDDEEEDNDDNEYEEEGNVSEDSIASNQERMGEFNEDPYGAYGTYAAFPNSTTSVHPPQNESGFEFGGGVGVAISRSNSFVAGTGNVPFQPTALGGNGGGTGSKI